MYTIISTAILILFLKNIDAITKKLLDNVTFFIKNIYYNNPNNNLIMTFIQPLPSIQYTKPKPKELVTPMYSINCNHLTQHQLKICHRLKVVNDKLADTS